MACALRMAQAWPLAGLRDADARSPPPWPTREVFAPRADAVVTVQLHRIVQVLHFSKSSNHGTAAVVWV